MVRVWEGEVTRIVWTPAHFGIAGLDPSATAPGASVEENAEILREAIGDADSDRFLAILPSTAVTLHIAGEADTLGDAAELARETVRQGKAVAKLEEMARAGAVG